MIRNSTIPGLLAAFALAVTCVAKPAHAGPTHLQPNMEIQLQSGGETYNQFGYSPILMLSKPIGNFSTTGNTGTTTTTPSLDLSSVEINSSDGGTLVITLSENGLTSPLGAAQWLSQFSGHFVVGSGTVTLQTYIDNTNTLLGTGLLLATETATTPFALSQINNATTTGPFALTEVLTITTTKAAHVSLDASISYVPEPASLTLLASAMVGMGALARRKRSA